jgi:hypothetical protein
MPWRLYKCRAVQWKPLPTQLLPKRHLLPLPPRPLLLLHLHPQQTPRSNLHPEQPAMQHSSAWRVFSL